MFTVSLHNKGYKISTGNGTPVQARSVEEVQLAVAHYFGAEHWLKDAEACPFCRWIADRQRKRKGR